MIHPETISEKLQFSTLMIKTSTGVGTGLVFRFIIEKEPYDVLITNKHVVDYKSVEKVSIVFHTCNPDGTNLTNDKLEYTASWFHHKTQDLCFCFLGPIVNQYYAKTGRKVYYIPVTEDRIMADESLFSLNAIEQVVMIGYPIGLVDPIQNLPLIRHGFTAYPPYYDYQRPGIGVIDIAAFPGSSGSPVFILNEGSYTDVKRHSFLPESRLVLLGVLFGGPVYEQTIGFRETIIPCSVTDEKTFKTMMNLGYYIKASCVLELKQTINNIAKIRNGIINNQMKENS